MAKTEEMLYQVAGNLKSQRRFNISNVFNTGAIKSNLIISKNSEIFLKKVEWPASNTNSEAECIVFIKLGNVDFTI